MNEITQDQVQQVLAAMGFGFGVSGSAFLMIRSWERSHWGWSMYLASNICWIAYSVLSQQGILLAQNICFVATTFVGLWTWTIRPTIKRNQAKSEK